MDVRSPSAVFSCETYDQVIGDITPLLAEHHKELGPYQEEMPFDPELGLYRKASDAGLARIYTARLDTGLVGYAIYFIRPNPHYRSTGWAISDIIWVHPKHRNFGIGNGLYEFIEKDLKAQNVFVLHTTTKKNHPALGMLLESRGHVLVELGYQKRLK